MVKKQILGLICLVALTTVTLSISYNIMKSHSSSISNRNKPLNSPPTEFPESNGEIFEQLSDKSAKTSMFDGFNNETGMNNFIVPNIIHYIRFNQSELNFVDYICMRSAYVNHRPDFIYIHTDLEELTGPYWRMIQNEIDFYSRIRLFHLDVPAVIFGQPLSDGWRFFHGSDVARIQTMMKYGGIYFDNDVYVVRNLDRYRKYEMAIGWDDNQYLGSQVIIAHSQARFLPLWLDTYHEYYSDRWYYNAGERPTIEILYKKPELVHRVKNNFGVHFLIPELYTTLWSEWRRQDTIHLLMGHRSYLDPHYEEYPSFNEMNIQSYKYTFGIMARDILQSRILN